MYLVAITVCCLGLLLYLFRGQLALALDADKNQIAKRQAGMIQGMTKLWNDDKARLARLDTPILLNAWLNEKLSSIARHDPSWFEKQHQPTNQREEQKLMSDAVQRALDVTNFFVRYDESEKDQEQEVED